MTSYNCGDGHTITPRRWAWKQYSNGGTFQPVLTVFNSSQNSTCDGQIQVSGSGGLSEMENVYVSVFPNPLSAGSALKIEAAEMITEIAVYNPLGKVVYSESGLNTMSKTVDCNERLSPGVYFVNIGFSEGNTASLKVVVE